MLKDPITIFLSYASEDQKLAGIVSTMLDKAFKRSINIKDMTRLRTGSNWRSQIDDALDAADIMIVISTGKLKPSHSYTGEEVGYFRKSIKTKTNIGSTKIARMIIPITFATAIPDTISEFQGIGDIVLLDVSATKPGPIYKLLSKLDELIDEIDEEERSSEAKKTDLEQYENLESEFYSNLEDILGSLPLQLRIPKTKMLIRLPASTSDGVKSLESVEISFVGVATGLLARTPEFGRPISWTAFAEILENEDLVFNWQDVIHTVISGGQSGDFSDSDQFIFSSDFQTLYRLFVSKHTVFYDYSQEFEVYVVPIIKEKDYGDPFTTLLGKSVSVALRFRALFLEPRSPFAAIMFKIANNNNEFRALTSELLKELRMVLRQSREAGLAEQKNIIELFGSDDSAVKNITTMMSTWQIRQGELYKTAGIILSPKSNDEFEACKSSFIDALQRFCECTGEMNRNFTSRVVARLNEEVSKY